MRDSVHFVSRFLLRGFSHLIEHALFFFLHQESSSIGYSFSLDHTAADSLEEMHSTIPSESSYLRNYINRNELIQFLIRFLCLCNRNLDREMREEPADLQLMHRNYCS